MKNKFRRNAISVVVIAVAAGLVVYFWSSSNIPNRTVSQGANGFAIASTTFADSGTLNGQNYAVTAYYPVTSGAANAAAWNAYALALVQSQVDDFKTAIAQSDVSNLPPQITSLANTFNLNYSVDGTSTAYASVVFSSETYLLGMAHPSHLLAALNVDLRNGAIIKLADLFKPGSGYLQKLSTITTADMLDQIASGQYASSPAFLNETGGTSANAANFEVFGISPQGLVIHFQDYQVGPGASGETQVVIPLSALQDVAAPGGLLY